MHALHKRSHAVFLDRDGTIIEDVGYLHQPEGVVWKEGTFDALRRLQDAGYLLVVVTNQSGIGRGMFAVGDMERVHGRMKMDLAHEGIRIAGFYHCPHTPDVGCDCRKPRTGLIQCAIEVLQIDGDKSWLIGDKLSDVQAGSAAGLRSILVYNDDAALAADTVYAPSIADAATRILESA